MQIDLSNGQIGLELIKQFQGMTWLPTIKGGLSFDLLNNSRLLMGDIDKKVAHMKLFDDMESLHYIVATSLCTFEDDNRSHEARKCYPDCSNHPDRIKDGKPCRYKVYCTYPKKYNHTFRFIFVATVSKESGFSQTGKYEAIKLTNASQFLTGTLYIIPQMGKRIDTDMSRVLHSISLIEDFVAKSDIKCATGLLEYSRRLAGLKGEFDPLWQEFNSALSTLQAAYKTSKVPRPVASIEVLLSRDGLMLLRNVTDNRNLRYFEEFKESLESATIPMHRMFKTAGTYVKFLFHKNYNHQDKNDSYMPVSNLRNVATLQDMSRVVRHQMESLLVPVIQIRRALYKNCKCNPSGIIGYARAFLEAVRKQGWLMKKGEGVEADEYEVSKNFISNLMEDVRTGYEQTRNSVVDFLTVQSNVMAIVVILLTFVLTAKELIVLFDPLSEGFGIFGSRFSVAQQYTMLLLFSVLIGIVIKIVTTGHMNKSYFRAGDNKRRWAHRLIMRKNTDYSDVKELTLPLRYRFWLWWVNLKTSLNPYLKKWVWFGLSVIFAGACIWGIIWLLF